ncbi:UDP-N-acetylglucosamine 2-epimerase [Geomesophilobacter sediminis]|uniref:UDP-N-acetylglucosamine 2-epimerase (Hydrolyzing) n=1 Tax=Geomesophilobacter sediminis TaxID=2798584 RepID=A0A8J7LXH2_9BACT|nr:UDP-N-acetylglucosamine 2-epimerase [Geomesophilobacter sediminis]MBJ6723157.1 UDP-N-acetylglucosamine 2-epimerase (hydrolyzing) [Geomesophilobacter sediminis]
MAKRICVVTGSRAEYGLLYWLMKGIQEDGELQLQVVATGMHLSPEFGLTYQVIENDGFTIDAKIDMLLSSDTPVGIAKSIGLGVLGSADVLYRLHPDILVLLGDRFEILAVAQAALVARIPIAHIGGGDTTEGAFDEAIRHSITKMSQLHFVTNELSARRVLQMGEPPEHVYNVGSPGLDQITRLQLLSRDELQRELDFELRARNVVVTFHPVTLEMQPAHLQFKELLSALVALGPDVGIIFTKPNADTGGKALIRMIDEFCTRHPNAKGYTSLGQLRYLSALSHADAAVGNSSSGLYEAPSLKIPTVNIGDRQKGRLQPSSVLNCEPVAEEILQTIRASFELDCRYVINPYGDGNSSQRIVEVLKSVSDPQQLLKKHFHEVPA